MNESGSLPVHLDRKAGSWARGVRDDARCASPEGRSAVARAGVRDYLQDPGRTGELFDAHLATQASEVADAALPALRLIGLLARGYGGRHVGHPKVSEHRGRVIEADAAPGRVSIELDGEPRGTLPARYEVLPGALRVLAAPA